MSSIFLSHNSLDKPFVEKLAKDLKRIGIHVWYDKWEIKVGESLLWRIEEGIQANQYLGIVLSPEALNSEWVKSEISAAWTKQIQLKKIILLPIYYRTCQIPLFLADRKYADFRVDYEKGFNELAGVFGIKETETITEDNWRKFTKSKTVDWKKLKRMEFERVVTAIVDLAINYNWSVWVGGTANEYSITLSARTKVKNESLSIKLVGKTNAYMATFKDTYNPNHLKTSDFDLYIGNSVNACEEYVWRVMEASKEKYGLPLDKAHYSTQRFLKEHEKHEVISEMIKKLNWYKGDKL